jgi:hypothetical protein
MGGAAEFKPGDVFAKRYEIQRSLGEGDRKRTYLALDKKMDRLVAISFVKPEAARMIQRVLKGRPRFSVVSAAIPI